MVERDGLLYGRGTADMKGYLACVLAMVPSFVEKPLKTPIHIIFSYDEEVGCTGVRPMIAELGKSLICPRAVFVGEPTEMNVVDAHKGPIRWHVDVTGRASHSSMPHLGVNAISYGARIIHELLTIEAELKTGQLNPRFTPAYNTLQVTQITGGTAFKHHASAVLVRMGDATPARLRCGERGEPRAQPHCAPRSGDEGGGARVLHRHGGEERSACLRSRKERARPVTCAPAGRHQRDECRVLCDGSRFVSGLAERPSVVCGPGNIDQAHKPNEFIAVAELGKCLAFFDRLADWAASN